MPIKTREPIAREPIAMKKRVTKAKDKRDE
jgi:hypothetical protein